MFDPTSRYAPIDDATIDVAQPDGTERDRYASSAGGSSRRRRSMTPLVEHTFADGERLDILAARYVGDPEAVLAPVRRQRRRSGPASSSEPGRILDRRDPEALTRCSASTLGVRLLLWIGDTVPMPPRPALMDALTRVQVTNDADSGDGFQLTFSARPQEPARLGPRSTASLDADEAGGDRRSTWASSPRS